MALQLRILYEDRYNSTLKPLAAELEKYLKKIIIYPRIDNISVRAKSVVSFCDKANKILDGKIKYSDPLNQIQDQIGARIITYYTSDVSQISKIVEDYFGKIEKTPVIQDDPKKFGYESLHYILFIPEDVFIDEIDRQKCPNFFELQVATLFQHAWSEAEHNLGYKPEIPLSLGQERRIAFTAAQAWGADMIFEELFKTH